MGLLRGKLPDLKVGVRRVEKVTSPAGSSLLGRACHGPSSRYQRCVRIQFDPTGTDSHTQLLPELIEVHHNRGILPLRYKSTRTVVPVARSPVSRTRDSGHSVSMVSCAATIA